MKFHQLSLCVMLICTATANAQATGNSRPVAAATLSIPRHGVTHHQILTGKLNRPGYPIVLVRADRPDARWWVQNLPAIEAGGKFTVQARFGNEKSSPDAQFKVIVVVLSNAIELEGWKPGDVIEKLPPVIPRSTEETVTYRRQNNDVQIIKDVMTAPKPEATVARVAPLAGYMKDHFPVVLVRAAAPGSPWWVQPGVKRDPKTGSFTGKFVCGNRRTPDGSRFLLVVLAIRNQAELRNFQEGVRIQELPATVPRSEQLTVTLRAAP